MLACPTVGTADRSAQHEQEWQLCGMKATGVNFRAHTVATTGLRHGGDSNELS